MFMKKHIGVALAAGGLVVAGLTATAVSASASVVDGAVPPIAGTSESPSAEPSESASASPSDPASPSPSDLPTPSGTASPSPSASASPSVPPSAPAVIGADRARAIALAASGGGTITKFELKDEHSARPEYRVEIDRGRDEHRIRIDAITGVITRHDIR
jgi:hypothetical protein